MAGHVTRVTHRARHFRPEEGQERSSALSNLVVVKYVVHVDIA